MGGERHIINCCVINSEMESLARCSGVTRGVCTPQLWSCKYPRTHCNGVLDLVLSDCSVRDALHPWQTPSNLLRLRSTLASMVTPSLTPAGRQCSTPLQVLTQPYHIWLLWTCPSPLLDCATGDSALLIFLFPELSTGSGQNNKDRLKQEMERTFPITVHLKKKKSSLIPGPKQVLPLFKLIS